jgi:hypothetical protein
MIWSQRDSLVLRSSQYVIQVVIKKQETHALYLVLKELAARIVGHGCSYARDPCHYSGATWLILRHGLLDVFGIQESGRKEDKLQTTTFTNELHEHVTA